MAIDTIMKAVADELEVKVTENIERKLVAKVDDQVTKMQNKLDEAITGADLHVKIADKPTKSISGAKHETLPQLIKIAANRLPVLLVGMAGTGKTHAAEQVAEALDLDFYAMSVGAQTSKSDLMGFIHAGGQYVPSMFRKAFENGGVFLLDEIDAGNSNVLVQLNAALSNGYCAFPDRMVAKHEDFVFMASANTYGQGASRQYVGRNQLDAATLDRFVILDWNIDEKLEKSLAGSDASSVKWLAAVRRVRKYVEAEGIRALVSPRATIKGAAMLQAGLTFEQTLSAAILGGVSVDKQSYIKEIAKTEYDNTSVPEIPKKLEAKN